MGMQDFLNSYMGRYVVQSFVHSLTALAIVDIFMRLWKVENPVIVQKFRFLVILHPVFSFPIYQLLCPARGGVSFRIYALFDSARWLNLTLGKSLQAGLLLIPLFLGTSLILLFQEVIPMARQWVRSKRNAYPVDTSPHNPVKSILNGLPAPKLDHYVIRDNNLVLFAKSGSRPTILLSQRLLRLLSYDQLKVALAHEVAHTIRNRHPFLILIYLVRLLMFYNPVTLIAFRRAVSDEEKICDDMAVSWTGKPQALADTLKMFYFKEDESRNKHADGLNLKSVTGYGHNLLIKSRVERLEREPDQQVSLPWLKFALTLLTIGILNYYIVSLVSQR